MIEYIRFREHVFYPYPSETGWEGRISWSRVDGTDATLCEKTGTLVLSGSLDRTTRVPLSNVVYYTEKVPPKRDMIKELKEAPKKPATRGRGKRKDP